MTETLSKLTRRVFRLPAVILIPAALVVSAAGFVLAAAMVLPGLMAHLADTLHAVYGPLAQFAAGHPYVASLVVLLAVAAVVVPLLDRQEAGR